MPHIKYYSENGKLVKEGPEKLNETNLDTYIKMHNAERAIGYLEAVSDFVYKYDVIFNPRFKLNNRWGTQRSISDTMLVKKLNESIEKQREFCSRPKIHEIIKANSNTRSTGYFDALLDFVKEYDEIVGSGRLTDNRVRKILEEDFETQKAFLSKPKVKSLFDSSTQSLCFLRFLSIT